ncbi:M16 family metallopeptidase [Niabella drilacis]|uniref:Predicted Zn-dependent peptidase n=1 Tax=Niabella drilacis (strain DSM 25811 / CCM 8410 / CCUG 62505 / LMG 26954 / E90) TaxID=1285928 RepID=A0A1G6J4J7_NIADE|nr:pitrilysin family protein [Niabella drilacis]SDC13660.1 Predicted Zn-dependent peptidase [Niabella drilacis]
MKKRLITACVAAGLLVSSGTTMAQKVAFTEYKLDNGLHVILHQDKSAPVVAVSVMYHVGSKNEVKGRTGFAHFFEHLLFEGSPNIKRGEFMKYVSANGGQNNANTSFDRTFYYEVFPSNQLELGLWLESERMLHPIIADSGVNIQREVVKEERRMRYDNTPYGGLLAEVAKRLFRNTVYEWMPIGSMEDLNQAKLDEFIAFFKKHYVPNNAALVISGDIDIPKTKALVQSYFSEVPKGAPVVQPEDKLQPLTTAIVDTAYDANIQIPALVVGFRSAPVKSKEAKTFGLISTILSGGGSSRLRKKMVDEKKEALAIQAFDLSLENGGGYIVFALPNGATPLNTLLQDIDSEIKDLQTNLISEQEYQKLINQAENDFVGQNTTNLGIVNNLADAYTFQGNTNAVNTELDEIKSITREDIRAVARKYLGENQRLILYYLPKK